jgi:MYXO-CTERM domain-containing protein
MGTKTGGGNLILNCDSHDNYDPTTTQGDGQNADGFGVHYQTGGATTIIRGCRSWWNSDDGYDLINQEIPVTVENSWAFGCGYSNYGAGRPADGNGNGFKMGSSKTGIRHLVQNNVAWGNKANGFYANHSAGGNTWYNNTSFQNGTQYDMLASSWNGDVRTDGVTLTGTKVHIMRNNIGFPNKNVSMNGVDTQFNTWDLNITPAAKDFLSITDTTVGGTGQAIETTSLALGPRQADGSLPNVDFLKLAAGSAMIDKGTDVQLPFVGAAPDLGAYEFGATGGSGGGGTTGAAGAGGGGSTAAAGAAGGGSSGAGGAGRGGSTGAAGASGGGGAKSGGAGALGGTIGRGGTSGGGGGVAGSTTVAATGGTGISGSGGTSASGGAPGSGGTTTADTSATGGSTSAGGGGATVETGGTTTAVPETGGSAGSGTGSAVGGESGTAIHSGGSSSGCSYALGATSGGTSAGSFVAMLGVLGLVLYRRRRRTISRN